MKNTLSNTLFDIYIVLVILGYLRYKHLMMTRKEKKVNNLSKKSNKNYFPNEVNLRNGLDRPPKTTLPR